jgi:hypothetical protein
VSSDLNDICEGLILSNKDKSDSFLFKLLSQDKYINNNLNDDEIKQCIEDTKLVYRLN